MSNQSLSSPCMSDRTLLLSVEDLISLAMGPKEGNTVDFKMIQTILHILARQMRLLEQKVVLVSGDVPALQPAMSSTKRGRSRSRLKSKSLSAARVRRGQQRSPPVFKTEEERIAWETEQREREDEEDDEYDEGKEGRPRRRLRSKDDRKGGRGGWDDDTTGGQDTSTFDTSTSGERRGRSDKDEGKGRGRADGGGRGGGGADRDDERGGREKSGGARGGVDRDDDGRGGRDRSGGGRGGADRDDDDRGGRDRSGGGRGGVDRDDNDRGGRDRSGGGRGGADRDDDDRGGRDRSGGGRGGSDRDDDARGGRAKSGGGKGGADRDGDDRGGRDRSGGGRGGSDRDDDGRGGRAKSGGGKGGVDRDGDDRGGRDRSGGGRGGSDRDDDGRGGRDRSGGGRGGSDRDDDGRGGRDRTGGGRGGSDRDDDGRGGRDRSGGGRGGSDRDDDGRGGRDRSGGGRGGSDRDDDGRGGRDRTGGQGSDRDERERGGQGGRERDGGRGGKDDGRGGGRGGTDYDDGGRGGRDRDGGGKGGKDDDGVRGGKGGAGKGGKDDEGGQGGKGGQERDGGGAGGREGIGVREVTGPGKEKLLVIEKGPTTMGADRDRRDSIAVVTQSQFQFLKEAVEELQQAAGPLPAPTMPDNKQLRKDLAAGASLTDTMQAMQVSARVKAAEQAIGKLGGLLTQLAASGALPPEAAGAALAGGWGQDGEGAQFQTAAGASFKLGAADPSAKESTRGGIGQATKLAAPGRRPTMADGASAAASSAKNVTEPEMTVALKKLREEVNKALQGQIDRAVMAAETAEKTATVVGGKVEELLKMDSRITEMHSMVEDYSDQLNGFDAGLTTQLKSFKDQMSTMRSDLASGMAQLEAANNNAETAAVMELNERYEGLVHGLEQTLLLHTSLTNMQHQLTQELKSLLESVEALREQKADRDELLDGLRDKVRIQLRDYILQADNWRLEGLVKQEEFERARADLEQRLDKTNEKFQRQDDVWMEAVHDLTELARTKAQVMDLLKLRDEATAQVREIDQKISRLAIILGEPKAAMLMRKLARDAVCASCLAPALMEPGGVPAPPLLPAARGAPPEPCAPEPHAPPQPDLRTHRCHRWVGGSHTLLPAARAHAGPLPAPPALTNKYTGYGNDGRMYWMETEMQPCEACMECNPEAPPTTERSEGGGGAGGGGDGGGGDAEPLTVTPANRD